ncbi:MAG: tetratricopeptide repeat protein, partial [Clostridia bacterium]|nr:tetratricopeptide repeat protein [Clostridia bacterium]
MKKDINIFIGSSIVEFEREREQIENFIFSIGQKFRQSYGISVEPLCCENFDDAVSAGRKQEEYNEKIRKSDYCYFLFFTKVGQYTREEFDVAVEKFRVTGKPKIYTYFKELGGETAEETVAEFKNELDKLFGHYYGTFEHIDTVKLRILLNLKLQELDFVEIKTEGDYCTVDGVKALPLENISEFANNQIFKELKAELQETEERYFALKARYVSDDCTEGEAREYAEIATKRSNLLEAIEELRKSIFNMSLRMCKDEIRGEITPRQKEAYRLFEAGDIEGANRILDFSEIKSEYERKKAIRKAEQQKETQIFIRETKTKIDMLGMLTKIDNRFQEIEALYDEITAEAFDIGVEADAVIDFVWFLYKQNKHQKAYETAFMLKEIFVDEGKITDSDEIAKVYLYLGTVCSDMPSKKDEAEEYLIKAIEISEELARQNPERFNPSLATSYNNAGNLYSDQGQTEKAEEYHKKAIAIREELARQNPERFNPSLATSYNNAGVFYKEQGQAEKAEEYYIKAIAIREELARQNPERFKPDLA